MLYQWESDDLIVTSLVMYNHLAMQAWEGGYFCLCAFSFVDKIGYIDCVHAEGVCMNTLSIVLYLVKGSDYVGHPNESFARESIYSQPVTGSKSYKTSHKPSEYCWSYTHAQFCFRWFITYF